MRFLSLLIIVAAFMLPGFRAVALPCAQPASPPSIRIDVQADQPLVNHERSRMELKNFDIATISPYGTEQNVHVNGLMRGAITIETQMSIAWQRSADDSDNCFWYDHITLNLKLNPTIYIAQEIPENSCLYNEVLKHEYKHYDVDYTTAKDFQVIFQDTLERFIQETGVIGPFPAQMRDQPKNELAKRLEATVSAINDRMKFERVKRQALIDTRAEYERVAHACSDAVGMM